ncbi:hypothetical protein [Cellulomonas fimi]|nr:hypothetical protein [Cellulomonas fimi]NNH07037.1 hypothetical protein [Cellulomonas fimi]
MSELLGHAGTQITEEVYAHPTTPTASRAMELLSGVYQLGRDDDVTAA